ncbi:MAG: tRNA (guanosine(37)-N1)-methyltransferase TrmD, partial [Syntrophomonadaceae bacterium]|nr:tRNA (guanosine(37)-N1)-methyltransferase TrmD [Syntrophomonadaceae bacterium]
MKIDILSLFPEMFVSPFNESIIKRAREKGLLEINLINIRDFAPGKHQQADDYPFGGGAGMV